MLEKDYIRDLFVHEDELLQSINQGLVEREMPLISVPAEVGYFLHLLVKISEAKSVLEIGALGGYSTIWLARALPKAGRLLSIDLDEEHIAFAKENIRKAGLDQQVTFSVGDAKELLQSLIEQGETFDFFFIDADKVHYPDYLEQAVSLANPGAIITLDNLLLRGRVVDPQDQNPAAVSVRKANSILAQDPRLESTILPIGDGVGMARVIKK